MDFAKPHIHTESVVTCSNIQYIPVHCRETDKNQDRKDEGAISSLPSLDDMLLDAANQEAYNLFFGPDREHDPTSIDCKAYPERLTPQSETIQPDSLVVIFESFDNLNFCYAETGAIFHNRNGHFHHDDFIGKPYGCKIRSRNNRGYGFLYLLKPTPELWARSLKHRTQIVHELDASMIVFYLNLRPNMVVCESGTGSGALSHCILRSIAPHGLLHTYEFNQTRAETARTEFAKNGVCHLVTVHHRDVCGKHGPGGFDQPQGSVHALVLDLPEPWDAVPYAAFCLKPNARLASYSPCVEQSQKTTQALKRAGFHSIKTMEFRLKEHYVDEVEYEFPPKGKRQRLIDTRKSELPQVTATGDDTGGETYNEKSENETEDDNQESLLIAGTTEKTLDGESFRVTTSKEATTPSTKPVYNSTSTIPPSLHMAADASTTSNHKTSSSTTGTSLPLLQQEGQQQPTSSKRKTVMVARPFNNMRGHTAFLTFATAGNTLQPHPEVIAPQSAAQSNML